MSNDDSKATATANEERRAQATPGADGAHSYQWNLTKSERCDPVTLCYQPEYVLPIVFVPGIMGSNLKGNGKDGAGTDPVWRLDTKLGEPLGLLWDKFNEGPGIRQKLLHPDRTEVDPGGAVPSEGVGSVADTREFAARGWGEVGQGSYHGYLKYLEEKLNGVPDADGGRKSNAGDLIRQLLNARERDGAAKCIWMPLRELDKPSEDELKALAQWRMPVYAFGYNWLADNGIAADRLLQRIKDVIARNNQGRFSCKQVLVITHSMGGLVSRACAKLDGAEKLIAGIINGVMPANGAAVAYRRCKVGMWDESAAAAMVIGRTGQHVTAVFAQAPGALELLPTKNYSRGWLEVQGPDGKAVAAALHVGNPYDEIYQRRDRWWGLIKEEWLSPKEGAPITWSGYLDFLKTAKKFHAALTLENFHPNTHVFYGDAATGVTNSFERVVWKVAKGRRQPIGGGEAPSPAQVYDMSALEVRMTGTNPERVGGEHVLIEGPSGPAYDTSHWDLMASEQDGSGDGTVPASSGRAPLVCPKVLQVFKVEGIEHEPAYKNDTVQKLTLYSLCKLVAKADAPAAAKP